MKSPTQYFILSCCLASGEGCWLSGCRKLGQGWMLMNLTGRARLPPPAPGSHVAQGLPLHRLPGPVLPQEEPKLSEAAGEGKAHTSIPRGPEQARGLCHLAAPPSQEADGIACLQLILSTHVSSTPTVRWDKGPREEGTPATLRLPAHSPLSQQGAFLKKQIPCQPPA